jgi:lipopolysaccharide/colanic/teichoic acid biosynthesis glycosyltransferase
MSATHPARDIGMEGGIALSRRVLDVVVCSTTLVLLSPVMAVVAVLVRLSSPGPALFRQTRIGERGVSFTMYKFRSMAVDAGGPHLCLVGDPRVTPVGAFLRKTRIDELPQLVNVLRGEMTLVGPRPETVQLARRYPLECRQVLLHRPGVTGPVQVRMGTLRIPSGADGEAYYLSELVPRRVRLDLEYLAHPTLGRTVALLAQTAVLALRRGRSSPDDAAQLRALQVVVREGPSHRAEQSRGAGNRQ